tara:strand:- start:513 stop:983 length:471 start_codon:yes stop_codon:yes gene_type:complete
MAVRSKFETSSDRWLEEIVAFALSDRWSVEMKKLPIHQRMDFAMVKPDGSIGALCEIKVRKFKWGDFPDVILSASKVKYAKEMWSAFALRTILVVMDKTGEIRYLPMETMEYPLAYGGRTKSPRDEQDSELIVHVPNSDFVTLTSVDVNIKMASEM